MTQRARSAQCQIASRPGRERAARTSGRALRALLLAAGFVLATAACGHQQLRVAPDVLNAAPREVLDRVRADPYQYFRLTNREWTARVCEVFAAELRGQPVVQLHGDAHVAQFAIMNGAWGLDDFDDSARGPALVDIVRFLGSIDLAARGRGWSQDRDRLFDRFFEGYRRGLSASTGRPPEPAVVRRLRVEAPPPSREAFLQWADTKMRPMADRPLQGLLAAMDVFSDVVRAERPDLRAGYFHVVSAGWLQMGVGSAGCLKVLIRAEGPTSDPADDVLLEAKALRARGTLSCLEEPTARPAFRVVQGSRQVGRLKHEILVAGPELTVPETTIQGQPLRDWWIRSWDRSYLEIALDDLRSPRDLAEIVYDSGLQLSAGTLQGAFPPGDRLLRARLLASLDALEPRLRLAAPALVQELLRGWHDLDVTASRQVAARRHWLFRGQPEQRPNKNTRP